jgi:Uma2 family endonuclease
LSAFTLAGFRAWTNSGALPEHLRVAFLGNEIYVDLSEEALETQVAVKMEVARVLMDLAREDKLGKFYGDGTQVVHVRANMASQPDSTFLSRESLRSGRVRVVPRDGVKAQAIEIEGTPDWVLAVVSNNSVQKDTQKLREIYHRAGITEYWIIDVRGEDIVFQILEWRDSGYALASRRAGWQRSRVFGQAFRLERRQDELGLVEYRLHVQSK